MNTENTANNEQNTQAEIDFTTEPAFIRHESIAEGLSNTAPGETFSVEGGKRHEDQMAILSADTPPEKSRLFHMDEAAFTPDIRKVQNHSQSGKMDINDNPGEFYRHSITAADLSTKHIPIDSMSELVNAEKPAIDHPVVSITVNQEENSVTATYGGKTLIERNPGDWFVQGAFQVNQPALRLAWKTKFKEALPVEFQTSFSFNGGFSMGGKRNLFTAPPARPKRVSKHASGQSKKKKRK